MPDPPKPTPTRGRPKPRAGVTRMSKEERDRLAQEKSDREAQHAADAKSATRGSGVRGRGRGRPSFGPTDDRRPSEPTTNSSVFGAGSGLRPEARRATQSGYSEMLGDGEGVRPEADASGRRVQGTSSGAGGGGGGGGGGGRTKLEDSMDIDLDNELDDQPTQDIEQIWISSGEEGVSDRPTSRKGKARDTSHHESLPVPGLRPLRAPRVLREDEKERRRASKRVDRPLKKAENEAQTVEEGDVLMDDEPVFVKEQPSSPEMRRRTLKKTSSKSRDLRPSIETPEERAERIRTAEDLSKLRAALAQSGGAVDETDGDKDDPAPLFLFQLPPLTPMLVDSAAEEPVIKTEHPVDNVATAQAATKGQEPKQHPNPKPDPADKERLQLEGLFTASSGQRLPAGFVGKLRVHRSGKVSLDWGGTDMEIRYGSEVDFLQNLVLVETKAQLEDQADENDIDDEHEDEARKRKKRPRDGVTYDLGQVHNKMVCIPDWAKLYD